MSVDKLLQRPLYAFDLPEDIVYTLQLKQTNEVASNDLPSEPSASSIPALHGESEATSKATSCNLCGLTFESLQDQRSHVRSDLHNYNLKQKVRGLKAVSEGDFEKLIGELDESLSGSDSDGSSEDEEEDFQDATKSKSSALSTLLKRQARLAGETSELDQQTNVSRKKSAGRPPLYWFQSKRLPTNTSLGVYRAVFSNIEQEHEQSLVETLQRKQLSATSVSKPKVKADEDDDDDGGVPLPGAVSSVAMHSAGPHYFLCMIGGGHFAAMLIALAPKKIKKGGVEDRSATVLAHKTFHRYTTRRKQGGSQSANDNSKGNAHSAGSSLRRYNESALEADVRSLLAEWRPWLDTSELIFIRATGSTNRRTLFGPYDGQVLSQKDDRLRGFPFNTRRATQSELMRAFIELTRVKVSTIDEAALARQAAEEEAKKAERQQHSSAKAATPKKSSKPSKEDEEALLHTTQLQALIRRSKAPALVSYLLSNSISADFSFFPSDRNHHAPTPLHLASASNSSACVSALLVRSGADPGVRNGDGRTAFELAGDRATRDAFCLARGQLGEAKWSWDEAEVPAAITQTEADARATKDKDEKLLEEKAEIERRQAELQRLRKEDQEKQSATAEKKLGKGRVLDVPMTAEQRRKDNAKGMTEEMRLRVEREQRARAAEERMRRLKAGS